MKVRLLYPDRDFDVQRPLPPQADALQADLGLPALVGAMAGDDELIARVAGNALLNGPGTPIAVIRYRQAILRDALAHPDIVQGMYAIATAALEEKRKGWWGFSSDHPSSVLYSALHVMQAFLAQLRALRGIAEAHAGEVRSDGLRNLFALLRDQLDDAWLARAAENLEELQFRGGALMSVRLGPAFASDGYMLRWPRERGWLQRLLARTPSKYTVRIAERDLIGARTLEAMRDHGVRNVADALAQSVEHVQGFLEMLRTELAFYVGCVTLHAQLTARSAALAFPEVLEPAGGAGFRARGLRDAGLVLATDAAVVPNDVDASGRGLVVVTGANQGGKSTFLRSLGLALLMAECGMFVAADEFMVAACTGIFTHYKREEDATMQGGKLDEELARLGSIADAIRPGAWLLSNESFASTNEREGSELARQTVTALRERGVSVAFVTHLYDFAHALYREQRPDALFLRAARAPDGTRSFRLEAAPPRATSYGEDLYREVFGDEGAADGAAPAAADAEAVPAMRVNG